MAIIRPLFPGNKFPTNSGGGGGHKIQDEEVTLPQQPNLNFVGSRITAVDNDALNRTDIIIESGLYHNQYTLGAQAAVNDGTARTLLETPPMTYGGLVSVNGTIDIQLASTVGNTEIRVETALMRSGASIGNLAGMNSRWTFSTTGNYSLQFHWSWDDARPGDTVLINVRRQAGTMTWACGNATTPWHGVHVIERPL